jgi:hypothetical protein
VDPEFVLGGSREYGNAEPEDFDMAVFSDRAVRVITGEFAANAKNFESR